jgi:hypothetical protein
MRLSAPILALLLVLGFVAAPVTSAAPAAPKVAVIVGPVGDLTGRYLARGEAAAREAERFTPNVVRVFTPDATWPAVRRALDGASLVVYLGHGNGWPSKYRSELFPPTQNGFGLNPVAGDGHDAHQYFGEGRVSSEVQLAKNAVVLLHHLCYASGNTEPGLPEGTPDEARQRVDNYAAGFIAAGASAVVAEGHMGPAWYVEQILSGNRSIERIWNAAPTNHGNTFRFESSRSPGFVASMDPDRPDGGYYRSLVVRSGLRSGDIESGGPTGIAAPEPTLVGSGLELGRPYLKGGTVAGTDSELWIPFTGPADLDPAAAMTVGVRWDPLDDDPPEDAGDGISLVQPERPGTVVEPVSVKAGATRIRVPVRAPAEPGRYRLVMTLHDATGVAYDGPTQGFLPAMRVRVTGPLAAAWIVESAIVAGAGNALNVPVTVANVGSVPWGSHGDGLRLGRTADLAPRAVVVGHWVRLDAGDGKVDASVLQARLPSGLATGATHRFELTGTAPMEAGDYLLLLDVFVPGRGSMTAAGGEPLIIRVTVE